MPMLLTIRWYGYIAFLTITVTGGADTALGVIKLDENGAIGMAMRSGATNREVHGDDDLDHGLDKGSVAIVIDMIAGSSLKSLVLGTIRRSDAGVAVSI
ncbi:MAG: hypothetical protein ACI89J_003527 [Hyphomicrobiaceae bacterium]|jgi:hypothetical protein